MATHQRKTKRQSTDNDENADLVPDRKVSLEITLLYFLFIMIK